MMDWSWLSEKLDNLGNWFLLVIKAVFAALADFIGDMFIAIVKALLGAILFLFQSLPAPSFLNGGMSGVTGMLPDYLVYFLTVTGFGQAMAILGTGVAFRLLRKVVTLGQW